MKESSLDLADKRELDFLAELIADLRAVAPHVNFLLVGAMARDLLLYHTHGIRAERATKDADLALAVADWNDFERLHESLMTWVLSCPTRKLLTICCIGSGWRWTLFR
jgi:predicted nucleotidyltransferase